MSIHLEIKNIKNIQYADLFLPSQKGMYALVGENGCGKSTIMLALSLYKDVQNHQKNHQINYCQRMIYHKKV